jgi:hypothetical protein
MDSPKEQQMMMMMMLLSLVGRGNAQSEEIRYGHRLEPDG